MSTKIRSSNIANGAAVVGAKGVAASVDSVDIKVLLGALTKHLNLILAITFLAALYLLKAPFMTLIDHEISEISVKGDLKHLSTEMISKSVTPWLDQSFLTSDLNQMKSEVQSLPWVYESTLTRVWPGKVEIFAVEQQPVAIWNKKHYLNSEGDVYSPETLTWEAPLPNVFGPNESSQAIRLEIMSQLKSLEIMLSEHGYKVGALRLTSRGAWDMVLDNGLRVSLGMPPFEQKIERVASVLNGAAPETLERMAALDARYPNGVAIRWDDENRTELIK